MVIDAQGRVVQKMLNGAIQEQGMHYLTFYAQQLPEGMYTVLLRTQTAHITKRVVVIKN